MDRVGLFGLVQGTCLFVLNIYESVNVNAFMQNINVKVLYLSNIHNFQITLDMEVSIDGERTSCQFLYFRN